MLPKGRFFRSAEADAAVVDALEDELVETVSGCAECITLLLQDLEQAHRTARASARRAAADREREEEESAEEGEGAQGAKTLLQSERARAVRQSRASVCSGLDALSHLLACSVAPRGRGSCSV